MAGVVWGGLVPHPPLIIPGIGRDEIQSVQKTVDSMKIIAQEIQDVQPDNLVIITPHGPVFHDGVPVWDVPELSGTFAQFGYPNIRYSATIDQEMVAAISSETQKAQIPLIPLDEEMICRTGVRKELDHGIMVPLHYLLEEKLQIPVVLLSIGWINKEELFRLGRAIQNAAERKGYRTAVLASGDLSHCLHEQAPAGYSPAGRKFDESLKSSFAAGELDDIMEMDSKLVSEAAECGYRPIIILLGALSRLAVESRVLSYEGPFGVGYMVVSFSVTEKKGSKNPAREERDAEESPCQEPNLFVDWAKTCLEQLVLEKKRPALPDPVPEELSKRAGAFVSIKKNGLLRGCIGTVFPVYDCLAEEIRENAISAGIKDPRFYPVTKEELPYLEYSVDVLSEPKGVTDTGSLDPKKYGVIVRRGNRMGLLLPDLEGINTAEEQLDIACQKAGIDPNTNYDMERFQVTRYE